jgi:hypothetical protein
VSLDNTASIFAGLGALCLAWFPTKPGGNKIPVPHLTPLQDRWGRSTVWWFHIGGTFAFVSGLAIVSYLFGVREGKSARRGRETITGLLAPVSQVAGRRHGPRHALDHRQLDSTPPLRA